MKKYYLFDVQCRTKGFIGVQASNKEEAEDKAFEELEKGGMDCYSEPEIPEFDIEIRSIEDLNDSSEF